MTIKTVTSSGSFCMLVGSRPYCSDPAWDSALPTPRNTVSIGPVHTGGIALNACITAVSPPVGMSGIITVADNDFSTGWTELILGGCRLINSVEYEVGVLAANTATNLAAAINRLSGFRASALGTDVTVTCDATMGDVDFRVLHRGTHTNFTLVPATDFFVQGDPYIGPPVLT